MAVNTAGQRRPGDAQEADVESHPFRIAEVVFVELPGRGHDADRPQQGGAEAEPAAGAGVQQQRAARQHQEQHQRANQDRAVELAERPRGHAAQAAQPAGPAQVRRLALASHGHQRRHGPRLAADHQAVAALQWSFRVHFEQETRRPPWRGSGPPPGRPAGRGPTRRAGRATRSRPGSSAPRPDGDPRRGLRGGRRRGPARSAPSGPRSARSAATC